MEREPSTTQLMPAAPAVPLPREPSGDITPPPPGHCACASCDARHAVEARLCRLDATNVTFVQRIARKPAEKEWRAIVTLRSGAVEDGNGDTELAAIGAALEKLEVPR